MRSRSILLSLLSPSIYLLPSIQLLAWAQAPLRFEVASIRPVDRSIAQRSFWRMTPAGDLQAHEITMLSLITSAYGVSDFQVSGYPAWVVEEKFDVSAKSGKPLEGSPDRTVFMAQLQARLQSLLSERCGLVVQHTSKKQVGYALTVDKGRVKLLPSKEEGGTIVTTNSIHADRMSLADLSSQLTNLIHSQVIDQTGVAGTFQIDLKYSRTTESDGVLAARTVDPADLSEALRDQLGLRLVKQVIPTNVLVVKEIQRPSAN